MTIAKGKNDLARIPVISERSQIEICEFGTSQDEFSVYFLQLLVLITLLRLKSPNGLGRRAAFQYGFQ